MPSAWKDRDREPSGFRTLPPVRCGSHLSPTSIEFPSGPQLTRWNVGRRQRTAEGRADGWRLVCGVIVLFALTRFHCSWLRRWAVTSASRWACHLAGFNDTYSYGYSRNCLLCMPRYCMLRDCTLRALSLTNFVRYDFVRCDVVRHNFVLCAFVSFEFRLTGGFCTF